MWNGDGRPKVTDYPKVTTMPKATMRQTLTLPLVLGIGLGGKAPIRTRNFVRIHKEKYGKTEPQRGRFWGIIGGTKNEKCPTGICKALFCGGERTKAGK